MRELDEDLKWGDLVIFKEPELTVKVKVSSGARVYMQVAEDEAGDAAEGVLERDLEGRS